MEIIIHASLPALQCGHGTAIKVFNQALRECTPPWWMEIIIPILPRKLWIITCTTISGKTKRVQHMQRFFKRSAVCQMTFCVI